jgi:hypothetical protein
MRIENAFRRLVISLTDNSPLADATDSAFCILIIFCSEYGAILIGAF